MAKRLTGLKSVARVSIWRRNTHNLAWLKVLSALAVNLAAGWFGAAFIAPNFVSLNNLEG